MKQFILMFSLLLLGNVVKLQAECTRLDSTLSLETCQVSMPDFQAVETSNLSMSSSSVSFSCDNQELEAEPPFWSLLYRSLWRLALGAIQGVAGNFLTDVIKENLDWNIQDKTREMSNDYPYNKEEVEHIINEWNAGNPGREHVAQCPICNRAAKAITSGTNLSTYVPNFNQTNRRKSVPPHCRRRW